MRQTKTTSWLSLLVTTLLVALLAGCANPQDRRLNTYAGWRQMEPLPQPKVVPVPVQHVLIFAPGEQGLSQSNQLGLLTYLGQSGVKRGDTVGVSMANPIDPMAIQTRLGAVQNALNSAGVVAQTLPPLMDPGIRNQDQVILTTYRYAAVPLPCPGYASPIRLDFENRPISSFGCSTANNLALQVADPADLVEGKPLPPADGEGMTLSIQRYRAGETIPLEEEETSD